MRVWILVGQDGGRLRAKGDVKYGRKRLTGYFVFLLRSVEDLWDSSVGCAT